VLQAAYSPNQFFLEKRPEAKLICLSVRHLLFPKGKDAAFSLDRRVKNFGGRVWPLATSIDFPRLLDGATRIRPYRSTLGKKAERPLIRVTFERL
jgi:hypothetical protein